MALFHNYTESWFLLIEEKYLSRIYNYFKLISIPVTDQKVFIHNFNVKNFSSVKGSFT